MIRIQVRKRDGILNSRKNKYEDKWYSSFLPNGLAGGSTSPLIPLFVTEGLGGTVAQVGIISSASSVASVPSSIIWSNLSDRLHIRKFFIILGFFGMAISLFLMGISTSIKQYFSANLLMGILATASAPVGTVLVIESSKRNKWSERIGTFTRIGGVGWVFGLVIGTVWLKIGTSFLDHILAMRALFIIASVLSLLSMFLALKWISRPERKVDRRRILELTKETFRISEKARYLPHQIGQMFSFEHLKTLKLHGFTLRHKLMLYYSTTFFLFLGFLTFYVVFPIFLVREVNLSGSEVFLIYIASSAVSALTYKQAGVWVENIGSKKIQLFATSTRILLIPSFALVGAFIQNQLLIISIFVLLHAMMGFCWAMINVSSVSIVLSISPEKTRGEAVGLYNAIIGIANIVGGLAGGFLVYHFGYSVAFVCASTFILTGNLLLLKVKI